MTRSHCPRPRGLSWSTVPTLLLVGCAPVLHPLPAVMETDPLALLARAEAQGRDREALATEARIEGRARGSRLAGRATLLVLREGRLRLDLWTPTDLWVATFLADADLVRVRQRGEPCRSGPSCPENLAEFLPRGWELPEVCEALLGRPPISEPAGSWEMSFDRRMGAWELQSRTHAGGRQRLWIHPDGTWRRFQQERPGIPSREWEVEERDQSRGDPVRIRFRSGDDWVRLRLRDVEWNPDLSPEDFQLECPGGELPMPCLESPE